MILGEPIILGGGGGIPVVIIVETKPGASVLCINGTTIFEKTANADGKAVFEVKKEGLWTIQASLDGETVETEVFVEHKIEEMLTFIDADSVLANNSWEVISQVARAGLAKEFWNIGDKKKFTVDDTEYTAQIMDFDVYDVADPASYGREKAGIVFHSVQCSSSLTVTDWSSAQKFFNIKESTVKEFAPTIKLPELASYKSTAITFSETKGLIPSEQEIFGVSTYENIPVGTQYAFYAAGNSKVKKDVEYSEATAYWTRSRDKNSSSSYVAVNESGKVVTATRSNYTYGFCL